MLLVGCPPPTPVIFTTGRLEWKEKDCRLPMHGSRQPRVVPTGISAPSASPNSTSMQSICQVRAILRLGAPICASKPVHMRDRVDLLSFIVSSEGLDHGAEEKSGNKESCFTNFLALSAFRGVVQRAWLKRIVGEWICKTVEVLIACMHVPRSNTQKGTLWLIQPSTWSLPWGAAW